MKNKLIAIVIAALLAGGVGTTVVYTAHNNAESAQIIQEHNNENDAGDTSDTSDTSDNSSADVQANTNGAVEDKNICESGNTASENQVVKNQETEVKNNVANVDKQQVSTSEVNTSTNEVNKENVSNNLVHKDDGNKVVAQNTAVNNNISTSNFMAQVEQLIYNKVNEERVANGVSPLSYNTTMEKYARIKSQDMGDKNYFDHKDLNGNLITTNMKNDGVSYRAWGENIAYISGVSDPNALAQQFMTNWMNSEGHRKNILSNNFSSIGIGVYKVGNKVYATQEFYK